MRFRLAFMLILTILLAFSSVIPIELALAEENPTVLTNNHVEVTVTQPICSLNTAGNVTFNTQITVFNNESFPMNFSVQYDVVPAGFTTTKNASFLASGEYNFTLDSNANYKIPVSSVKQTVDSLKDYALIVYTNYQYGFSVGPVVVYFGISQPGESSITSQIELALAIVAAFVLVSVVVFYVRHTNKLKRVNEAKERVKQ